MKTPWSLDNRKAEGAHYEEGTGHPSEAGKRRGRGPLAQGTPTLRKLVAQITPKNRYDEVDWGPEQGRERIASGFR